MKILKIKVTRENTILKRISSKLHAINSEELLPLINKLKEEGVSGYQELLVEEYVGDIISSL